MAQERSYRPYVRWGLRALAVCVIGLVCVLGGARWWITTEAGHGFLERQIEARAPNGQTIEITKVSGDPLNSLRIERLQVFDTDGLWLDVRSLRLDWSAWSLLGRRLEIDTLFAQHVQFREPHFEAGSRNTEPGGDLPLNTIGLDRLDIARLDYLNASPGLDTSASVFGSAHYDARHLNLELDLVPLAEAQDRAAIQLSWSAGEPIQANVNVRGVANGWLAGLAGLGADEDLTLVLEASGDTETWQADGRLDIAGQNMALLEGTTAGQKTTLRGRLNNTMPWLPDELAARLGAQTVIDLSVISPEPERYQLSGTVSADGSELQLSAELHRAGNAISAPGLALTLSVAEASALLDGTGVLANGLQVTGAGRYASPNDVSFQGEMTLSGLATQQVATDIVSGPVSFTRRRSTNTLETQLGFANVRQSDGSAVPLIGPDPVLEIAAHLRDGNAIPELEKLRLRGRDIRLEAQEQKGTLTGSLTAGLSSIGVGETASFLGDFSIIPAGNNKVELALDGQLTDVAPSALDGTPLPDDPIQLGLRASVTEVGTVEVSSLNATSGPLEMAAAGRYAPSGAFTLNLNASAEELILPGIDRLEGLQAAATASGTLDQFSLTTDILADRLTAQGTDLSEIETRFSGTGSTGDLNGRFELGVQTRYGPLAASAQPALDATGWSADLVTASLENLTATGQAEGSFGNLSDLTGRLEITGHHTELPFDALKLTTVLTDGTLKADGDLTATSLGPVQNAVITLDAAGDFAALTANIALTGDHVTGSRSVPLALRSALVADPASRTLKLDLDGTYASQKAETTETLAIDLSGAYPFVSGTLGALSGTVRIDTDPQGTAPAGTVEVKNMSVAGLTEVLDLTPLAGVLSGTIAFDLAAPGKRVVLAGTVEDLTADQTDFEPISVTFGGELSAGTLRAQADLASEETTFALSVTGETVWSSTIPALSDGAPVVLELTGDGQIAPFSALFLPPEVALGGQLGADVKAQLLNDMISATGAVSLAGGRFEHGDLGLVLNDLAVMTELRGDTLQITQLTGRSTGNGQVDGTGQVSLSGAGTNTMALTLDNLLIIDRTDATARLSGTMNYAHEDDTHLLAGDLRLNRADIRLDRLIGSARPTLPVRFDDAPAPVRTSPSRTRLRINLDAPGRIFAEGQGVDAELSASVRVRGDLREPLISAEAEILRGDFAFAGQSFDLVDSTITLPQGSDEASLNIRAERQTTDFTAVVNITGTQTRPIISLSSTPSLPENEILSRILFGLSPTELSPIQTARLAAALASLAGGSGFDVLGRLENALSLDRLDLSETEDGTAIITTGKYIRPNVYVQAENRVDGSVGVAIDWEVLDTVTIRGETDPEDGQEVSIFWRRDFDRFGGRTAEDSKDQE